jgi:hypothetical protein
MDTEHTRNVREVRCYVCGKSVLVWTDTNEGIAYICTECTIVNSML